MRNESEPLLLLEKKSPWDHLFPPECTLFEKCLFIIMHLSAGGISISVFIAMAGKEWAFWSLIGSVAILAIAYTALKISLHFRGEKVSFGFNPSVSWAGKKYGLFD